jgi:hypothetical protein
MAKKIKPCESNLIKALKACAKAHNAKFADWREEGQIGIQKECVPVFADVQSILRAFYKPEFTLPDMGYGYITAYIYGEEFYNEDGSVDTAYRSEVDEMMLGMALPYGEIDKIKWARV